MHQTQISKPWIFMLSFLIALSSCSTRASTAVDDPRTYAIATLQTMDLNTWWQAYRNPDPMLLGQIIDEAAATQPNGLPTDSRQLDTFIRHTIVPRYKLYMDDTEEGKAFILAQAEARFANPPMTLWDKNGHFALLDYHILPGEWKLTTRINEGLADPPAVSKQPFLRSEVIADSLQRLTTAYPDARAYQIRYQYHHGSDLKKILMEFSPDTQIVYKENGNVYFTEDTVAWDDLLNSQIDLAALDWDAPIEGDSPPPIGAPPSEPLPSRE